MAVFVARRLLGLIPLSIGISLTIFLLIHFIPGDPAEVMLGFRATPQAIAQLHHAWHLDEPLPVQYVSFVGRLLTGDLGVSVQYQQPVRDLLWSRIPETLLLALTSTLISVLIGVPLAALSALQRDRWPDILIRLVTIVGFTMPSFWLALLLMLLLGSKWRLFPIAGYGNDFGDHLYHLVLPSVVIALSIFPLIVRTLRTGLLEVLRTDYVRTARAKGLGRPVVVFKHVLRNALIPTVAVVGVNMGYLLGGAVVIESVFGLPGVGYLLISAINYRDYPMVQAGALVLAMLFVLVNLLTDIVYRLIDPRIRNG
jgi:ABC-type dipeptide/oligopeptide/nickel transport system permease component